MNDGRETNTVDRFESTVLAKPVNLWKEPEVESPKVDKVTFMRTQEIVRQIAVRVAKEQGLDVRSFDIAFCPDNAFVYKLLGGPKVQIVWCKSPFTKDIQDFRRTMETCIAQVAEVKRSTSLVPLAKINAWQRDIPEIPDTAVPLADVEVECFMFVQVKHKKTGMIVAQIAPEGKGESYRHLIGKARTELKMLLDKLATEYVD